MKKTKIPSTFGPRWARWVGKFFAYGLWKTKVVGKENVPKTGPVIYAANHIGYLDGPILLGVAPKAPHILVKEEMFQGFIGWVLRRAGQISVNTAGDRTALNITKEVLKQNRFVGIFPEGSRGAGQVSQIRGGLAWLVAQSGATVVPVAIIGTRNSGQSVSKIPRLRSEFLVAFGRPITMKDIADASVENFTKLNGKAKLNHISTHLAHQLQEFVSQTQAGSDLELPTE